MLYTATMPTILCCMCGLSIEQNPSNMCVACLRSNVDVTEGINRQLSIHSCRSCGRFLCPPWQNLALESKELLATCLRKIPGLNKVKLIDAVWIWTEPHSMRLKIKLTVQKEVMNGAVLQQAAIVEFTIRNQQCKDCEASYAQGSWHAVVQVRQRVSHKRTFYFLEQLLLKHNAHSDCIRIVTFRDGMDFYFTEKNVALRFVEFLNGNVPTKVKYSRKLISADHTSNIGDFKHNYLVEIAPVCKNDLVILPVETAKKMADMTRLVLINRVAAGIHVIDPLTGERGEVSSDKYWNATFTSVMTSRQFCKFVILSVEPMLKQNRPSAKVRGRSSDRKIQLAECVVARERDLGVNDRQLTCITHLGNILKEGDLVLGYDLTTSNWNVEGKNALKSLPDVLLVRKFQMDKRDRLWELKNLGDIIENEDETASQRNHEDGDYEMFLQELEADKDMRANINLYKKQLTKSGKDSKMDVSKAEGDEDSYADSDDVQIDELLDDMNLITEDTESSAVIISADQAAVVPEMKFDISEFDVANFTEKDFKFK